MAPILPLSPAELSYLSTSLSTAPPTRPDSRSPTQFRPLIAELDILPSTHGSARMVWGDGSECIAGIKAEVEKTVPGTDRSGWVEIGVEVQGQRDDDPLGVFLGMMVAESLVAGGVGIGERLVINERFHWKLFVDVLLITPPLSHPTTLLSLSANLALRATRLPRLKSEADEDPVFDDDWDNSTFLYSPSQKQLPPITLLVVAVAGNIFFDPTREEMAVGDCVLAVSLSWDDGRIGVVGVRTLEGGSEIGGGGVGGVERGVVKRVVRESLKVGREVYESLQAVVSAS